MYQSHNTDCLFNPITRVRPKDFALFITDRIQVQSFLAFHLTLTYKRCEFPVVATRCLSRTLPLFLKEAIAARWDRKRYHNTFEIHAFLDNPRSRTRRTFQLDSLEHAQDGLHHHCIVLAKRHIYCRIVERSFADPDSQSTSMVIPRAPTKSIHLAKADNEKIAHITSYASKSSLYLSKAQNDDYYHFFDHRGVA